MKQSIKSQETKSRIFQAAKSILQERGYDELSIKHICEVAGVSNGSFYHHFKSKEDLLSYYIEEQPDMDYIHKQIGCTSDLIEQICLIYDHYVLYCLELGVEFLSAYYNPKNQALNHEKRTLRAYPILTVEHMLEEATQSNPIHVKIAIQDVITDIRMIVIGNVFEWCVTEGTADFRTNMRRSLHTYLSGVLVDVMS